MERFKQTYTPYGAVTYMEQMAAPLVSANFPNVHFEHDVDEANPTTVAALPGSHETHANDPMFSWIRPGEHGEQLKVDGVA